MVTANLQMTNFLDTALEAKGEIVGEMLNSNNPTQTCFSLVVSMDFQHSVTTPPLKLPLKQRPNVKRQNEKL